MHLARTLARALVAPLSAASVLGAKAGQIVTDTMKSGALGGMSMRMNVYLPDGHNESNGKYRWSTCCTVPAATGTTGPASAAWR